MKLHLPTRLRAAVLACFAVVTSFSSTLATGVLAGGVFALAMSGSRALAAYDGTNAILSGTDNRDIFGSGTPVTVPEGKTLTFAMEGTGSTNWFNNNASYNADIIIDGGAGGTTGMCINNGGDGTVTFAGAVTGGGLISKTGLGTGMTLRFTGNVSEFTGNINLGASAAFTLKFESTNNSSETKGVSGTGDITFKTANNTLEYNYSTGNTVYVTNAITKNGGTSKVKLSGTDAVVFTKSVVIDSLTTSASSITFAGGSANIINSTLDVSAALAAGTTKFKGSGTLSLGSGVTVELGDISGLQTNTEYLLFEDTITISGWDTLTQDKLTVQGHAVPVRTQYTLTAKGITFTAIGAAYSDMTPTGDFTWNYTDQVWNTEQDSSDAPIAFAFGDSAVFSQSVNITMAEGGVTARNVLIQGNGTTVAMTGGAALTVEDALTIGAGATLTLNTSTGSSGAIRGVVTVQSGGTLQFNARDVTGYTSNNTHTININEGGRLVLNISTLTGQNETFRGTLNLDGTLESIGTGVWDLFGGSAKIVTGDNKNAEILTSLRLRQDNSVISVGTGSTLTLKGDLTKYGGNGLVKNGAGKFVIEKTLGNEILGNVTLNAGTLELLGGGNVGTITTPSTNAHLVFGGVSGTVYTVGAWNTTNGNGYSTTLTVREGVSVNMAANGDGRSIVNSWGFGSVVVNGTLTLAGDLFMSSGVNGNTTSNLITGSGVLNAVSLQAVNNGTYNFSVAEMNVSGNTTISRPVNFLGGTVNLNGTSGFYNATAVSGATLNLVGAFNSNDNGVITLTNGTLNIKSTTESGDFNNTLRDIRVGSGSVVNVEEGAVAIIGKATLAAPIINRGNLTLNGPLTVEDLSGFTMTPGDDAGYSNGENGYLQGSRCYALVENSGTLTDDAVTLAGSAVSGATYADGVLTFTEQDDSTYWVNTTVDAEALGEGKKYKLNGGTLKVGTDANNILRTAEGVSGTVELTAAASLGNEEASVARGKLKVTGVTLSLGGGKTNVSDISSFSSLELDNGTIDYHGANTTFNNLKVTANGGTIAIEDMKGDSGACDTMTLAGTTSLEGDLTIKSKQWKYKVGIEALSGSGALSVASSASQNDQAVVTIDSFDNYTGDIRVTKNNGSAELNATVSSTVSLGGLTLENGASANIAIQSGGSLSGKVSVVGIGNSLTSTAGGVNLSQLDVAAGAGLDLNGAVSALLMNQDGTVDLADMRLTDGAELTYGAAANLLSVTDAMLSGKVLLGAGLTPTETGVNLGLSSEINREKIDISAYERFSELKVVDNSWHLSLVTVDNVLLVGSEGVDYDSAAVDGKNTILLAGGELALGNTDVDSAFTTLEATALGGSIIAAGTESEVSFGTVTLADNATVTLKDGATDLTLKTGTLNLGTGSGIVLEAGQTLDLTAHDYGQEGSQWAEVINATSGAGTLILKAEKTGGASVIQPGDRRVTVNTNVQMSQLKLNYNGVDSAYSLLTITENGSLTVGNTPGTGDVPEVSGDIGAPGVFIIESTATVKVDGGALSAEHIMLGHNASGHPGQLEMTQKVGGSITTGSITLNNAEDTGNNTFNMHGGTLTITSTAGIGAGVATTITGGTLATDGADWGVTGASVGGVTVRGGNTITLTNATLTGSIDNSEGNLALAGTVTLQSAGVVVNEWSHSGNGYLALDKHYTIAESYQNLTATGVTWQIDGAAVEGHYEQDAGKAVYILDGTPDKATFVVNTGTVEYSADNSPIEAETTSIKLNGNSADGADTLQLNSSLREGLSITAAAGSSTTINLNGTDVVLDAAQLGDGVSASTVTLTGNGKYVQAAASNALNLKVGGVTDAEWTGIVSVSGQINGLDADALGSTNSWVELKGVSGYPAKSDTINTNILLTNNGESHALDIRNGWTGTRVTFAGQVSGGGDIVRTTGDGGTQTYVFAGDVSGWEGSFRNNGTANGTIVRFTGGSDIKANFDRGQKGNTLYNLQVEVDASGNEVEMSGSITATSLTVAQGTTVQITGPLALDGALTTNGVTQLAGDVTNGTTLGQVTGTAGTLEILTGDLTLTAQSDFHTLAMEAGSKLNLDLNTLGVTDLKNWSTGPMLTLDTLRSAGALSISALVDGAALLTLTDGESKTLAQITNCNTADLTLLVNDVAGSVQEKESDGFKYEYKLVKEGDSAQVLITATRVLEGWVAEDADPNSLADTTWTDGDRAGDGKWAGEGTIGKFYGFGEGTVNIEDDGVTITDSVVISAVSGTTEYTFAGGALNAAELYVTEGKLTIDNAGVTVTGDAVLSHDSELTVNEKLTVGGDMGVLDSAGLGNSGTVEVLGKLSVADGAEVSNAGTLIAGSLDAAGAEINSTGTLQTAGGTIGSLTGNGTLKNSGSLTILESTSLTSFSNSGSLIVEGDLSVASPIAQGGTVQADNITVGGNAGFTKVTTGKLTADSVILTDAQITTLDTAQLAVYGNVTVEEKTSLKNLVGSGKLTVANTLTLEEKVTSSVDVTASALELAAGGNGLGSVQTDMVSMAEGTTLSRTNALLTVEDITALSGETVGISVSDSAFGALAMDGYGRYVAADYLIINGAASADGFSYVNTWQLQEILSTGVSAELAVTGGVLSLRISAVTDAGGEEVGMIWDTRNEVANNGYVIDRGELFYRSLDYVHAVQVREDTLFDLTEAGVGDAVAGNASVPAMGLTVRNLSGGAELTVKGDGVAADTATFLNTENISPAEAVQLNADAVFVNLGAPEGVEGMMEGDADSIAPMLKSLALSNRAAASVNRDMEVLGDTELGDYTRLMVQEGSVLTTGMLSGTDDAEISGEIRVLQGGVYTGAYDEARITAADGSKLLLRTGGRRSLGLQAQSGSYVSLDGVGMDGRMSYLRVGQAPLARMAEDGTAELNILNTTVTDTGIEHSTIMLTAQEGNYINKSAVRLSLGAAETARTLGAPGAPVVIDGTVDVTDSSITVNMMGNAAENGVLEVNTDAAENLTLARFVTSGTVQGNTVTLTGTPEMLALLGKYYTNARLESDGTIKVDRVTDYYASRLPVAENAQVGIGMADAALVKLNPQAKRSELGELAGVLDALDTAVASGNTAAAAELGAAVSGASTAALGAAVAGDLERQLMSVRNRTTTMGVDQSQVNENMPYFNAWINAEGDFRRMDEDGMAAGYELSSWGGTVGFDVDVTPRLTMGIAATAMYGDFTAESADHAEGDLDTYYVTAFGRYAANRWSHTFVASVGMADTSLKRTVSHSHGSYSAEGDAEGTSFGFLYELGYVLALNETATACLQPIFNVMLTHSSLDGYAEEGGDAALHSSGVDMTAVTFGLGARAQAMVGANLYNRSSLVETRALLKLRTGDREAETENGLVLVPGTSGSVKAAEMGVIGLEFGAGITIPLGADGAAVFADAAVEVGGGFTNVNGTIGIRFNF